MAGIYIHIPFCKQACIYCNFHFEKGKKNIPILIDAICKEIELRQNETNEKIETIYFGGGTPSYIEVDFIEKIISKINKNFTTGKSIEITLEANPDDITKDILTEWKNIGINRLSIGVQSFFDSHLKWMNRAHNVSQAMECIQLAKSLNFQLSIDLIFGIPIANNDEWIKNLETIENLSPEHISCYGLTLEENTPWSKLITQKKYPNLNEDITSEQFILAHDFLEANGYTHYEISNYAKKNQFAVHNSSYWKGKTYLGFGPSAHSFNQNERYWNIADNQQYQTSINANILPQEREKLSITDIFNETIMIGLRTMWGIDVNKLKSLNTDLKSFYKTITTYKNKGWINSSESSITLTKEGMLYADKISSSLFI